MGVIINELEHLPPGAGRPARGGDDGAAQGGSPAAIEAQVRQMLRRAESRRARLSAD